MASPAYADTSFRATARRAEILDAETETELARAWRDERCEKSLHRLIRAYMRLAISMAYKYQRYGVQMNDLVQEASLGLMKAAEKFDPDRGVRFSTYAVWWIKASIQEFVMRNWSIVRTGSTSSQKSLFFNLRRVRAKIERDAIAANQEINTHEIHQDLALTIGVPLRDVEMMDARMAGSDFSLNAVQSSDDEGREWIETLEDDAELTEDLVAGKKDRRTVQIWLNDAMAGLSDRERKILFDRKLADEPRTLESLGHELGLSKERVRQLENAALKKMRTHLQDNVGREAQQLVAS